MKQYTFAFSNTNELQSWLEKLPSNTYMDKLATLYIPYNFYEFQWAIDILTKHCIKVVGCTSQLSIINSSLNDLRIILCLQCFTDTKIHILQFEDTNEESIKIQLDKFHNLSIPGMQIFSINCCSSIEKCIELIYQILNNTFIFGGLVGKGTSLQNTPDNELSAVPIKLPIACGLLTLLPFVTSTTSFTNVTLPTCSEAFDIISPLTT